jgi:transposase
MKRDRTQDLVLEQLRRVPIIQVAAEKVGVSRTTIYRWRDESEQYRKDLEAALAEGEALINDLGESQLLTLMKDKHWPSIQFWLRHRNPKFRERLEVTANINQPQDELTSEQQAIVREALRLAQLTTINITTQNHDQPTPPPNNPD